MLFIWCTTVLICFRDISKRSFVARFSSPSTSVLRFLPISLFIRKSNGSEDHINDIMAATKTSFLERGENHASIPILGEDVAIWLFISTFYNSDILHDLQSTDGKVNPVGFWRLALLVKNRVILGSALDARCFQFPFQEIISKFCFLSLI